MSVDVACPQCQSVLKAPPGMAGKKARCKRCNHAFRIPGGDADLPAVPLVGEESTQLNTIDAPFGFGDSSAAAGDEPESPMRSEPASRSKYKTGKASKSSSMGGYRGGSTASSGSKSGKLLVIGGVIALFAAGGAAAFFMSQKPDPVASASAAKPAEKVNEKADPKDAVKPKDAENDKSKTDTKADRKATDKPPTTTAPAAKSTDPKKGKAATVVGGLKLPPPPAKADLFTKPVANFPTENTFESVRHYRMTGGDNPTVIVIWSSDAGFQGQGAKETLDRYSLNGGARIDRTELDAVNGAAQHIGDLSPNGEHYIAEGPTAGMLTLYDLTAKKKSDTVKPFKPFATEDAKATVPVLSGVVYVSEKAVLAVAKSGACELWSITDGKKLNAGGLGITGEYSIGRSLTINGDRSAVYAVAGDSVHELRLSNLESKAVMTLPKGAEMGYAISLADTGERIAVAYRAATPGPHTMLAVGRIGDPQVNSYHYSDELGMPQMIAWGGPDCFVMGFDKNATAVCFQTEINRLMAAMWPQGGKALHASGSGKHAILMPDPADAKKCIVIAVDFPPDDYLPLINEASATKAPVGFLLTPKGLLR
jgi:hypothetical protein